MRLNRTLAVVLVLVCLAALGIYLASMHSGFGVR